jgi:hypothetical protein
LWTWGWRGSWIVLQNGKRRMGGKIIDKR